MEINDEIEITIIVKVIPNGERWRTGKLQTSKHFQMPIKLLDYTLLNQYLLDLAKDIENELQVSDEKTR